MGGMILSKSSMLAKVRNWLRMGASERINCTTVLPKPRYQLSWSKAFPPPSQEPDNKGFRQKISRLEQFDL